MSAPRRWRPTKMVRPSSRRPPAAERRVWVARWGFALALAIPPAAAHANGALPATIQILLPPDAPGTTIVATTFGLITSTDGGARWRWTCEHDFGDQGSAYQLAAPPGVRLFALVTEGLAASDDLACGWSLVMDRQTALPFDYFPDPTDARRILALGLVRGAAERTSVLLELYRGAADAAPALHVLYTAPPGEALTTLEIARPGPRPGAGRTYATLATANGTGPARVVRSDDAGRTWTVMTPAPAVTDLGILAVDPADPGRLYLRVVTDTGDELHVSDDGGQTLRPALRPGRTMSAFVALPNGHLLVGWVDPAGGYLDRSSDGGRTFTPLAAPFRPRALAERGGQIYAATDLGIDRDALVASDDEGASWRPVMRLGEVGAIDGCARSACAASCVSLAARGVLAGGICAAAPPIEDGAAADAAADAGPSPDARTPAATTDSGCTCRLGPGPSPNALLVLALGGLVARAVRSLTRSRRSARRVPHRRRDPPPPR